MGKSSARKPPPKKRPTPLDKSFPCPFCNHDRSVEVKLDRGRKIGTLRCTVCKEGYQVLIHSLSEPIDVYSEWRDACEEVNADVAAPPKAKAAPKRAAAADDDNDGVALPRSEEYEDD
eukprot:Opistho-1_new@32316